MIRFRLGRNSIEAMLCTSFIALYQIVRFLFHSNADVHFDHLITLYFNFFPYIINMYFVEILLLSHVEFYKNIALPNLGI